MSIDTSMARRQKPAAAGHSKHVLTRHQSHPGPSVGAERGQTPFRWLPELLTYFHTFSRPKGTLFYLLSTSPQPGSWLLLFVASACLPFLGHDCPEIILPSPHQTQNQPEISCNLFCLTCNLSHAGNEGNRLPLSRSKMPQWPCDVSFH